MNAKDVNLCLRTLTRLEYSENWTTSTEIITQYKHYLVHDCVKQDEKKTAHIIGEST